MDRAIGNSDTNALPGANRIRKTGISRDDYYGNRLSLWSETASVPVSNRMQRPKIGKRCGHHCFAQRALGGKVEPLVVTHCGCPECHDELFRKHTVVYGE